MVHDRKRISLIALISLVAGLVPVFSLAASAQTGPPTVSMNEFRIDQPGADNDEYFELVGASGTSLDGVTYLVIGDGTGGSGVIENVTDLTGSAIPASGYFVAAESSFTLGSADLTTSLNFENGDHVTHLLVYGFTGSNGDDLDTDDDGTLDSTPWTSIIDSAALTDGGPGEQIYSTTVVGPDGSFVPGHVYKCSDWEIGGFTVGTDDTPGAANPCVDPVPEVSLSEMRIDQPGGDDDEYFELVGTPGGSLDGFTYLVIGDGTGGSGVIENVTDLTGSAIPASGYFVAAESTFGLGTADLTTSLNFENSDNVTHLLVRGFSGANGDDLDTDDDGTLDSTPWTEIVDSVALVETVGSGDLIYSTTTVGPDGSFVPGHAYTCADWEIGAFDPLGGDDTPGAANPCATPGAVVINEVDYDQPSTDTAEFVELYNSGGSAVDLTGYTVELVNGSNDSVYDTIALPSVSLAAGDWFVVCANAATVANCDLDDGPDTNFIQNGSPDAVGLRDGSGTLVDAVSYEGSVTGYTEGSGSGLDDSSAIADVSISRCPDGADTDQNNVDFVQTGSTPGAANDCGGGDPGDAFGSCFDGLATKIHAIQGPGTSSPFSGQIKTIEGVVTGDFEGGGSLSGFFVQEEDADADADPSTSEGLFVYNGSSNDVSEGDIVRVRGEIVEFGGLTEMTSVTDLAVCDTGGSVSTTLLTSPLADGAREAVEGMKVAFTETLYVTDTFNLHTFGEVWLGMGGVIEQPTNEYPAGPAADALAADNMLRAILLDDLQNGTPSTVPFLHANGTLRIGDTSDDLVAIMDEGFGQYRLRPLTVNFAQMNPRTSAPAVGGNVKVASFNVLNYWTTLGCTDCRGAETPAQFAVQTDKLVAAIIGLGADIVALQEIENTNLIDPTDYDDPSHDTIKYLVDALNAAEGSTVWAWVGPADHYNPYPIRNEFIYRIGAVELVGTPTALAHPAFDDTAPSGDPYARPPVAQTFEANGAVFTVVNNHFKSKGSSCNEVNEGADGQGNCNQQRVLEAQALLGFVADLQAIDPDVLVVGDLNSYMREDPVLTLEGGGLTNLPNTYDANPYSYAFFASFSFPYVGSGSLDHGLATASLAGQVSGVGYWHINADEPRFLDWFDPSVTAPGGYRSADHDPLLIGLDLDGEGPEVTASASPDELWPPNHKYRDVEVTISATDPSGPVTIELVSVTSSEPDSGITNGDKPNDIVIVDDTHFQLRAERYSPEGRTYTITYRATDGVGNETITTIEVVVPHDQRNKKL